MRTIKTWLATIAVLLCSLTASVHAFEIGGISYNITSETDLTVEVIALESGYRYSGAISIPSSVNYNGVKYDVKSIGRMAFAASSDLISITIPEGVNSIDQQAFYRCSGLTSIKLPNSVKSIGYYAFDACSNLTSIVLSQNLSAVYAEAFANCSKLTEVYCYAESAPSTHSDAFLSSNIHNATLYVPSNAIESYKAQNPWRNFGNIMVWDASITLVTDITLSQTTASIAKGESLELTATVNPMNATNPSITWSSDNTDVATVDQAGKVTATGFGIATITAMANDGSDAIASCVVAVNVGVGDKFEKDGIYYKVISDTDLIVEVTYRGSSPSEYSDEYSGEVIIPSNVTYNNNTYNVTSIGNSAFYYCTPISITISEGVTSIGSSAFYYCSSLTSIDIPNSVMNIGSSAFSACRSLTSINIPNSVSSIGSSAFEGCSGLTALYISDIVAWCNLEFPDNESNPLCCAKNLYLKGELITELTIPEGVTSILDYAFSGCSSLISIVIPESVTSIGGYAFSDCSSLTSITISAGVTDISNYAFDNCSSLKSLIFEDGSSTLSLGYNGNNQGLFYDCPLETVYLGRNLSYNTENSSGYSPFYENQLSTVTIGNNVTCIEDYAFMSCSSLASITFPESVTSIGRSAFYGCKALTSVDIPNSLVDMGDNAFGYCTNLTTVHLGDSIADMGRSTFGGCESLVNVNIPQKLTRIEDYVFNNCKALERIIIPENITDIETYAFSGCSNLKTIINFSSLVFTKGSEGYGYVASEASRVINAPNGSMIDGFVFSTIDGMHSLVGYIGDDTDIVLPEDYKGENYLIGDNAFLGCKEVLSIAIPNSVTEIGYGAFKNCSGLTSIAIADNVTHIGNDAFSGCSSLKEVHIDNLSAWCKIDFNGSFTANPLSLAKSLYLNGELITEMIIPGDITEIKNFSFYNCSSITKVIIGEGVTNIGDDAFTGCSGLTEMVIPDNVLSIGQSAFYNCKGLTSVKLPANITEIGTDVFRSCSKLVDISIPENVTVIGESAFQGCSSLDTLIVPSGVKSIKDYAFYGCSNLKNVINLSTLSFSRGAKNNGYVAYYVGKLINAPNGSIVDDFVFSTVNGQHSLVAYLGEDTELTLPEGYKGETYSIGYQAFYGHSAITNITIPNSVTSISESAFDNCTGLKRINIPSGVTNIGKYAFYNCKNLEKVYVDDIIAWCKIVFGNSNSNPLCYAGSLYLGDEEVLNIVISDEITEIKDYAFEGCSSLVSVELGNSVTSIGEKAFSNCTSLATVTIPNSVTNIERFAFSGCAGLAGIVIPENIIEINAGTFKGCAGLTSVVIPNNVDYIGGSAFEDCTGLTSVIIGRKVSNIDSYAFSNCVNLKYVLNWSSLYLRIGVDNNGMVSYYAEQILHGDPSMADYLIIGDYLFAMTTDGQWTLSKYLGSDTEIVLPESCNGNNYEIGEYSFYKNSALASVKFSEGVTGVDKCAFANCSSLSVIEFSDSLKWIGINAFYDCSGISRVEIPENVVVIGEHAFSGCSNLVDLIISEGVKTIDHSAFNGCSKLTHVDIPEGVMNIGFYAFNGCSSLLSVTIPYTVASIGDNAFRNCSSLVTVRCKIPGVRLFTINDNVFEGIAKDAVLYVSGNDREIYSSTPGWMRFGWSNISRYNYQLSYNIDGEIYRTMYLDFGDEIPVVELPEKEGYTFSGWSEIPETMPANDLFVSGSFIVNKYLVTFKIDGEVIAKYTLEYGTAIETPEVPEKEGHTFSWGEVAATVPANDLTYDGNYSVNSYLLSYMVDGEIVQADSVAYGTTIAELEEPVKEGYTFSGWSEIPKTMPANDVTISGTFTADFTSEITLSTLNVQHTTIYDLTGRKVIDVNNLKGGVYIVDGKKVVIK